MKVANCDLSISLLNPLQFGARTDECLPYWVVLHCFVKSDSQSSIWAKALHEVLELATAMKAQMRQYYFLCFLIFNGCTHHICRATYPVFNQTPALVIYSNSNGIFEAGAQINRSLPNFVPSSHGFANCTFHAIWSSQDNHEKHLCTKGWDNFSKVNKK